MRRQLLATARYGLRLLLVGQLSGLQVLEQRLDPAEPFINLSHLWIEFLLQVLLAVRRGLLVRPMTVKRRVRLGRGCLRLDVGESSHDARVFEELERGRGLLKGDRVVLRPVERATSS
jgi:hypothetical protein